MRRRHALRAGGVAALAATAGCFDVPFERPREVEVLNATERALAVSVTAGANGEAVVDETLTVPADDAVRIEASFPGPGLFFATEYTLAASVEGGETRRASRSVTGHDGFDVFRVLVGPEGGVRLGFADAT